MRWVQKTSHSVLKTHFVEKQTAANILLFCCIHLIHTRTMKMCQLQWNLWNYTDPPFQISSFWVVFKQKSKCFQSKCVSICSILTTCFLSIWIFYYYLLFITWHKIDSCGLALCGKAYVNVVKEPKLTTIYCFSLQTFKDYRSSLFITSSTGKSVTVNSHMPSYCAALLPKVQGSISRATVLHCTYIATVAYTSS